MALSSVTVVSNALRLRRFRPPRIAAAAVPRADHLVARADA
jgi:hypothetical protein